MAKSAAKPAPAPRRGSMPWLQGLACGALVTLATPTALLAGVLLVPTLIVFAVDRAPGRPVSRAVLLYGLAGLALPLGTLWSGGHSMDLSIALVTDPAAVALAWAAQGAGWLLTELVPLGIRLLLDTKAAAETAKLRSERAALTEEWDSGR